MNQYQNKFSSLSHVRGRKIYFSGEMAGYYVLSPFKLTIVRNSITVDNATQYNDSNRKDSENNSITIPIKEAFGREIYMDGTEIYMGGGYLHIFMAQSNFWLFINLFKEDLIGQMTKYSLSFLSHFSFIVSYL